jgi:hypothetical protein
MAPEGPDQLLRLNQFRRARPGIAIHAGSGYWQAQIPEPDDEQIITRYELKELLDSSWTPCSGSPAAARRPIPRV